MYFMFVTLVTFHSEITLLNDEASWNMRDISVTLLTSHFEISLLKIDAL